MRASTSKMLSLIITTIGIISSGASAASAAGFDGIWDDRSNPNVAAEQPQKTDQLIADVPLPPMLRGEDEDNREDIRDDVEDCLNEDDRRDCLEDVREDYEDDNDEDDRLENLRDRFEEARDDRHDRHDRHDDPPFHGNRRGDRGDFPPFENRDGFPPFRN